MGETSIRTHVYWQLFGLVVWAVACVVSSVVWAVDSIVWAFDSVVWAGYCVMCGLVIVLCGLVTVLCPVLSTYESASNFRFGELCLKLLQNNCKCVISLEETVCA